MDYDSTDDTLLHIGVVKEHLATVIQELRKRAFSHDSSKLQLPEKEVFDRYTLLLRDITYGSDEYKQCLGEMGVGLKHHYGCNRHHPEHHVGGVDGMTLIDLIEMFCDWKAAVLRHGDGDFLASIDHNEERFDLSPQLYRIFLNTVSVLGWE